uniref:Proteasome inhibitor PI31 subunit n=1 Tax=Vombatus ursinus TaxID=29139 RepID=A0A4X2JW15_VOMUR
MAGLELLYASAAPGITCSQDALVCFVHWELVTQGYRGLGTGDQPGPDDKKSELLPHGWNANKDLYVLRYESTDNSKELLLKAIMVDDSMIINALEYKSQQVVDLTLNVEDYVDGEHLGDFHRVYKNSKELQTRIASGLILPIKNSLSKSDLASSSREFPPATSREYDPLRIPPHHPHTSRQPPWGQRGGMILDPLRSGFPRALIDPSSGLPNRLPPGAVPPGARFDPFGPIGTSPSGPSPDHLPPPGYDDMFM